MISIVLIFMDSFPGMVLPNAISPQNISPITSRIIYFQLKEGCSVTSYRYIILMIKCTIMFKNENVI